MLIPPICNFSMQMRFEALDLNLHHKLIIIATKMAVLKFSVFGIFDCVFGIWDSIFSI